MNWLERHLGETLVAIGTVHTLLGIAEGQSIIADLWRDGVIGSVGARGERNEWLWFTTSGGLMIGTGLLARSHLRRTGTLPTAFGAALLTTTLANGVLQPASAVWTLAAESILALHLATKRPTRTALA